MGFLANKFLDKNDLGFFATPAALSSAYPIGAPGYFATVGSTDTLWVWDTDSLAWVNSGAAGLIDITIGTSNVINGNNGYILYNNNGKVGNLPNNFLTSLTGAVLTDQTAGQTIGATGTRLTKLWVTDITCTNAISGSVTGNAGTVTGLSFVSGKTLTVNQIITLAAGADSQTFTFPASSDTVMGLASVQAVTGKKTFDKDKLELKGTSTGVVILSNANTSATSYTLIAPAVDDTITTIAATQTLTNKRVNPRLVTAASYTTDTGTSLTVANCDQFEVTAQAGALKFNNPGGTPVGGNKLIIRIKDDGTARALTYDTQFRGIGLTLPTTTVISKTLYMGFIFNATDTKWDLVAVAQEV